jgi:hypothetical protein
MKKSSAGKWGIEFVLRDGFDQTMPCEVVWSKNSSIPMNVIEDVGWRPIFSFR